ncbi:Rne/Rng family ribonuclease [Rhodoluna lacicola]|uniref:Ribonuclease E n=1 Tax=Rhodoluna lacicola TaxID=529884 RepID=A0A060JF66_9MICO|nr:Rne/Rng family ribonuclease [Rhodoluna lacicola]AIC47400.1 ribonuclease, Rne/Rng family [Rhodoluna lacicola]
MVKNEDSNVPAEVLETAAKKVTRARAPKKTAGEASEKPKKALITKDSAAKSGKAEKKAKAEKEPASVDEVVEKAAKKAPAKRGAKVKAEEVAAPITAAPLSATSLMFMAPDLPTPKVSAKGIANDKNSDDSHLRRRSRRRAGEAVDIDPNAAPNVVVKVRTPREPKAPSNEPTRVKGSTRLEAKKQRRRDGRDAGRRRTTITESEFLARREAVDRTMVVRSKDGKIQIGVLEDGILVEHYVAKASEASLIGNVYLGKVQNVLPSMEAAFVDVGRGRNAVLYSGEVDWELAETGNQPRRIELALKSGDTVLVQVTKDPVGQKGARLTSQVSLPGRYLVYVPNGSMNGISRKLPDSERARLKKILKEILPEDAGVIVRTAAEGATEEQLTLDVQRLQQQWEAISKKVEKGQAPALLHSEPDLLVKIVRDVFNEDFQKMVISGDDAREVIEEYLASVAPDLLERVVKHEGYKDVFDEYRVGEQIAKALERKVYLPSGGSLVIDRTEAMTVVDVNTGKFVGSGGNLEETVTKNNLEAAEEIVRQLRLRDIGGIIVVDFIDMVLESNRDLVQRRLMECLSRDRTKHQVAEVTSLGLVQMTRKKLGIGLLEAFSEPCEACASRGVIVHHEPIMRSKHSAPDDQKPQQNQGGNKKKNRDRNQKQETVKVVTAERAVEINNVMTQIAASTVAAHEAAGESSPITLPAAKLKGDSGANTNDAPAAEKMLEAVLDALPEPKAPGQGRRKPRRATSAGNVSVG